MVELSADESLDELIDTSRMLLVQFGSHSCAPCIAIRKKVEDWLAWHPQVISRYVPIEKYNAISAQHDVFGVPTIIFFAEGKETIRKSRYYSLEEFFKEVERLIHIM